MSTLEDMWRSIEQSKEKLKLRDAKYQRMIRILIVSSIISTTVLTIQILSLFHLL